MEGDRSNLPENEHSKRLAENAVGFQQFIEEIFEEIEQDEHFDDMTAESYDQKKSFMKTHLLELSFIHNSLADQYAHFLKEVSKNCPSQIHNQHLEPSDSTSRVIQMLPPKVTSGFDAFWHASSDGHRLSGLESFMPSANKPAGPPVNDDALKVEVTKYSGAESSMPSVNRPPLPPVDLKGKCELVDELRKKMNRKDDQVEILWAEKRSQDILIQQLKTELDSLKSEHVRVVSSFDHVRKLADELKVKPMDLEREVVMQKGGMSHRG